MTQIAAGSDALRRSYQEKVAELMNIDEYHCEMVLECYFRHFFKSLELGWLEPAETLCLDARAKPVAELGGDLRNATSVRAGSGRGPTRFSAPLASLRAFSCDTSQSPGSTSRTACGRDGVGE